jgi:hypothetical protein
MLLKAEDIGLFILSSYSVLPSVDAFIAKDSLYSVLPHNVNTETTPLLGISVSLKVRS